MVSKSENTKRKFEVESIEENDIQRSCYECLHGIFSKILGPAWCVSPNIKREFE